MTVQLPAGANAALQQAFTTLDTNNPAAAAGLAYILNSNPSEFSALNTAFQNDPTLTFGQNVTPNTGGAYDAQSNQLNLNLTELADVTNSPLSYDSLQVVFALDHETDHAANETNDQTNAQKLESEVTSLTTSNGPNNTVVLTGLDGIIQQATAYGQTQEDTAEIDAFNRAVEYVAENEPAGSTVTLSDILNSNFPYTSDFGVNGVLNSGFVTSSTATTLANGTIIAAGVLLDTSAANLATNLATMANMYYNNPLNTVGAFGGVTYANYYSAIVIETAINYGQSYAEQFPNSPTLQIQLNMTDDGLSAEQLTRALAAIGNGDTTAYPGGEATFVDPSTEYSTVFSYAAGGGAATASQQTGVGTYQGYAAGQNAIVALSNSPVTVEQGSSATFTGGNDSITLSSGAQATAFTSEQYTASLPTGTGLNLTSTATVNGIATVSTSYGDGNTAVLDVAGSNLDVSTVSNATVDLSGQMNNVVMTSGSTVQTTGDSSANLTCGVTPTGTPNTMSISSPAASATTCSINPNGVGSFTVSTDDSTISVGAYGTATISGNGNSAQGGNNSNVTISGGYGNTLNAGNNSTDTLGGQGQNSLSAGAGSTIYDGSYGNTISTSGSNIIFTSGVTATLNGSSDTASSSGLNGQTVIVGYGSAQIALNLPGATIDLGGNTSTTNVGAGATYNVTGNNAQLSGGIGGTYDVSGTNASITAGAYGNFQIEGAGSSVTGGPYGLYTVNASNVSVTSLNTPSGWSYGDYNLNGQNDSANVGSGAVVTLTGTGATVTTAAYSTTDLQNASGSNINMGNYAGVDLFNSSNNTIVGNGRIGVYDNGYGPAYASSYNDITALGGGSYVSLSGNYNNVNLAGNYNSASFSGTGNTATFGGIYNTANVYGAGTLNIGSYTGALADDSINVYANGASITTDGTGAWYDIFGSNTNLNLLAGGGYFDFLGSVGDIISAPGSGASGFSFSGGYGSNEINWTSPTANGASSTFVNLNPSAGIASQATDYSGSDETGSILRQLTNYTDAGSVVDTYNTAGSVMSEASTYTGQDGSGLLTQQSIQIQGGYSQTATFSYDTDNDYTGALVDFYQGAVQVGYEMLNAAGQVTASNGVVSPYLGSAGGSSGYAGYDLSRPSAGTGAAVGQNIASIAAYDLSQGNVGAAAEADAAAFQAAVAQSSDTGGVFTSGAGGATWGAGPITWSFATVGGSASAPISGAIGSQYQGLVEQAFAAWGKATGLDFVEESSSSTADIEVGWGDFDTAESGVLGLTTTSASNGALQTGAVIRLEDPSDTSLALNSSGDLSYFGTSATLYQVLLHEIGHAIGLGDSSDPSSVMYAVAGPSDASISASDVQAVQQLYSLTQAMSSLPSSGASGAALVGSWDIPPQLLATTAGATNGRSGQARLV